MTQFRIRLRQRNIPENELLEDFKRVAVEGAISTVTAVEYTAKGQYGVNTFLRRFKTWNNALERAGLTAPHRQHIPDTELFENLAVVWTQLGRQPLGKDMEKTGGLSLFSLGTYESRFGSWNKALLEFEQFIQSGVPSKRPSTTHKKSPADKRRSSRKVNWRLRAQVLIRDNCICQMCGASPAKDPAVILHADHIVAWSKGGETALENLKTLCLTCNVGKGDLDVIL
jgi:hypothetical protein